MPAVSLTPADLTPFAAIQEDKAEAMIADALALAARIAPCILTDEFTFAAAAKAILRGAVLRWNESGTGALTQQSAGPFAQTLDTRTTRRGMFWPNEIVDLQELCKTATTSGAFSIDTAPPLTGVTGFGFDNPVQTGLIEDSNAAGLYYPGYFGI